MPIQAGFGSLLLFEQRGQALDIVHGLACGIPGPIALFAKLQQLLVILFPARCILFRQRQLRSQLLQ
ncbi:hypothetical protein D9M69_622000 [compost metagenome]